jgi:prepilin-type N-terminal cleavage/methylation domain-containing protein
MKLFRNPLRAGRRPERAFTLVEIVLSLAIVAIALVAIIGVLPIGLNVQTDNQEESIISADAAMWMEAFRNGAQGASYFDPNPNKLENPPPAPLFNIHEIKVQQVVRRMSTDQVLTEDINYFNEFQRDNELIGLLSRPKYQFNPAADLYTNWIVYADVRALNGNMADLAADMDFAFKYRLTPEIVPLLGVNPNHLQTTNAAGAFIPLPILETNLFELRLNFQWPLVVGQGGGYRAQTRFAKSLTFRTIISGQQLIVPHPDTGELLYFVQPRQYSYPYLTNIVTQVNP